MLRVRAPITAATCAVAGASGSHPARAVLRLFVQAGSRRLMASESADYGKTFDKILIANRGEIACRVMKTAKKMGIKTVAVYSDADAHALHVRMADEAINIGPPPTSQSYLRADKILEAVKTSGAQAVHPGYGFLSENYHFVEELEKNGVTFIGPNAKAMFAMGDKIESKKIAKAAGVSTIPGFNGVVENSDHAVQIDTDCTLAPRRNDTECREAFRLSSAEAKSSFGDDRLLVEKFIEDPRHIEIQLIGDQHGNTLYLPERECSIQRRNQKVIEEAPSIHIDAATRKAMGEQAVALAKNVDYYSAGTCEFLVDPKRNFYFLEMNTRLQVEHPITEYITGLDLVEQMIRVAAKQKINLTQEQVGTPKGWAFESRVYAEDPEKYLPSIGRLTKYIEPTGTEGEVRCDTGIVEGSEISIYYDPMICKLCTYGETREIARHRMERALDRYVIKGVTHNIPLLRDVISHPRFAAGKLSTKFLAEEYPGGFKGAKLSETDEVKLFSAAAIMHAKRDIRNRTWLQGAGSMGSSSPSPKSWSLRVGLPDAAHKAVLVQATEDGTFRVSVDGRTVTVDPEWTLETSLYEATVDGEPGVVVQYLDPLPLGFRLQYLGTKFDVQVRSEAQADLARHMRERPKLDLTSVILSPMPGSVVSVAVKEGDEVAEGSELAVVEAMKMQNVIRAPRVGKIKKVSVKPGQSVAGDEIMIEFFPTTAAADAPASA
ncbi:hypothetical protein HK405_004819 [Cladochytrium tenue]|nr:hypothetical protein HK405_004819 [Cladochytrium tenue]